MPIKLNDQIRGTFNSEGLKRHIPANNEEDSIPDLLRAVSDLLRAVADMQSAEQFLQERLKSAKSKRSHDRKPQA